MNPLRYFLMAFALLFCLQAEAQKEVSGVKLAANVTVEGKKLDLVGAGTRSKYFMDLYVGALYLGQASNDGMAIVNADEIQSVQLTIISGMVTRDKFTSSTMDGFKASTGGNLAPIQKEIDQFMGAFADDIEKQDTFTFNYVPAKGTEVLKNGKLMTTIEGVAFKKALYGIWLGNKPADKALKAGMLGK
ncbi:chalcone isomerase family protein [Persicobacter sp. CCB-QB2]|uniref:chalcone isomerase family protein n=1 Tax=Persicobacter sp. CCB-QB2 TaxID=1561025 RepID=UPI0006A9CFD0|nr:chalcone isomerase family protein [Persicobacter sp. CCB-QB2]